MRMYEYMRILQIQPLVSNSSSCQVLKVLPSCLPAAASPVISAIVDPFPLLLSLSKRCFSLSFSCFQLPQLHSVLLHICSILRSSEKLLFLPPPPTPLAPKLPALPLLCADTTPHRNFMHTRHQQQTCSGYTYIPAPSF